MPVSYNDKIKKPGTQEEYTEHQITELSKCYDNPIYFIENYVKVLHPDKGNVNFKLYGYQNKILQSVHKNRFNVILCPRQYGKCVHPDTNITIRNKKTGNIETLSMKKFYDKIENQ